MVDSNKLKIRVKEIMGTGKCPFGHKPGDEYSYPEDRGKICPSGYYILFPSIRVLQFGGTFPWTEKPDVVTLCCSDAKNPVVFEIIRTKEKK